jgi:RsiW-degrading membrane proteinase PrsW (M82 family)
MPLAVYVIFAQIGVGWWLIQYLLSHDRGPKEPPRNLRIAGLLGIFGFALAFLLEVFLVSPKLTDELTPHRLSTSFLLYNTLLVGIIEEACKALPLALFIFKNRYFEEMTDGIIYFGICGMVFGVIESIEYTFNFGMVGGIARIIVGPFTHAALSSMIGYGLIQKRLTGKLWPLILGIIAAVGLHTLYDFGLFKGGWTVLSSLAITITTNLAIFILYMHAKKQDAKMGISASENNLYCHSCGKPNPRHLPFCTYCGKKT